MRYAQVSISDWKVTQVVELSEQPIMPQAILVPVPDGAMVEPGRVYDSLNAEFVAGPTARRLTHLEFMARVGYEKIAVILSATAVDIEVKTAWAFAENADFIDLDHPLTVTMLGLFALKGLLTDADVATLLSGGSL